MPEEPKLEGNRQASLTIQEYYDEKAKNLDAIESKFNTLDTAYRARPNTAEKRSLESRENIMSSLQTQGAEIISTILPSNEIQALVDSMYSLAEQGAKLINHQNIDNEEIQKEINKFNLANARTEAALKNFSLSVASSTLEDMEARGKIIGITRAEAAELEKPLEKALLKVAKNRISKEEYTDKVITEILNDLDSQGISKEKQEQYRNFILKNCNKKFDRKEEFSEAQLASIKEKASNSVDFFKKKFNEIELEQKSLNQNVETYIQFVENFGVKKTEQVKKLLPAISKLSPEELQEKGSKIVENFAPLLKDSNPAIANGAKKALAELDPKYLADAGKTIAGNIQKASKTTLLQKIKGLFKGKGYYAKQNVDKAVNSLKEESNKYTPQANSLTTGSKEQELAPVQNIVQKQTVEIPKTVQKTQQRPTPPSRLTQPSTKPQIESHVNRLKDSKSTSTNITH